MAAVLASGVGALLSHLDAAALWQIRVPHEPFARNRLIDVTVAGGRRPRPRGIRIHRVGCLEDEEVSRRDGIPVTAPIRTVIDLGKELSPNDLERAVNEADRLGLANPDEMRDALMARRGRPGVAALRALLDAGSFALTESELERKFLRLTAATGLPRPLTQQSVNGYRVDFYWPELRLVVETDGLRYHRTATQQSRDRARDQAHSAAGLVALRFTHAQVVHDPRGVAETLRAVIARQRAGLWTT